MGTGLDNFRHLVRRIMAINRMARGFNFMVIGQGIDLNEHPSETDNSTIGVLNRAAFMDSPTTNKFIQKIKEKAAKYPNGVNSQDQLGRTPLHWAACGGALGAVKRLLAAGADAHAEDRLRWTALHLAALHGQLDVSKVLTENGARPEARDRDGWTPVHWAASQDHAEVVDQLSDAGGFHKKRMYPVDETMRTPLHVAAGNGKQRVLELYGAKHYELNPKDMEGRTPIHYTVGSDHMDAMATLLRIGCDPNIRDGGGGTPLHYAAFLSKMSAMEILIDGGADPNLGDTQGGAPLHWVVEKATPPTAELLIRKGAIPSLRDNKGKTCLHWAVEQDEPRLDLIRLLLKNGVDSNVADEDSRTCLHYLAASGHHTLAKTLLDAGARPDSTDTEGTQPIHFGSLCGHADYVAVVHRAGASLEARDMAGRTPLIWAAGGGHPDLVRWLLRTGAEKNGQDEDRWTALDWALDGRPDVDEDGTQAGFDECIRILTDAKAQRGWEVDRDKAAQINATMARPSNGPSQAGDQMGSPEVKAAIMMQRWYRRHLFLTGRGEKILRHTLGESKAAQFARARIARQQGSTLDPVAIRRRSSVASVQGFVRRRRSSVSANMFAAQHSTGATPSLHPTLEEESPTAADGGGMTQEEMMATAVARVAARAEAKRLSEEAEDARTRAEAEMSQATAEAERMRAEAEAARNRARAEADVARAEAERAREQANADAAAARADAEREAARMRAEVEQARLAADAEAQRLRNEAEAARTAAEAEAAKARAEAEAAKAQAEAELARIRAEAEKSRLAAESEAARARAQADAARAQAEAEAIRAQAIAEAEANRAQLDAEIAQSELVSARSRHSRNSTNPLSFGAVSGTTLGYAAPLRSPRPRSGASAGPMLTMEQQTAATAVTLYNAPPLGGPDGDKTGCIAWPALAKHLKSNGGPDVSERDLKAMFGQFGAGRGATGVNQAEMGAFLANTPRSGRSVEENRDRVRSALSSKGSTPEAVMMWLGAGASSSAVSWAEVNEALADTGIHDMSVCETRAVFHPWDSSDRADGHLDRPTLARFLDMPLGAPSPRPPTTDPFMATTSSGGPMMMSSAVGSGSGPADKFAVMRNTLEGRSSNSEDTFRWLDQDRNGIASWDNIAAAMRRATGQPWDTEELRTAFAPYKGATGSRQWDSGVSFAVLSAYLDGTPMMSPGDDGSDPAVSKEDQIRFALDSHNGDANRTYRWLDVDKNGTATWNNVAAVLGHETRTVYSRRDVQEAFAPYRGRVDDQRWNEGLPYEVLAAYLNDRDGHGQSAAMPRMTRPRPKSGPMDRRVDPPVGGGSVYRHARGGSHSGSGGSSFGPGPTQASRPRAWSEPNQFVLSSIDDSLPAVHASPPSGDSMQGRGVRSSPVEASRVNLRSCLHGSSRDVWAELDPEARGVLSWRRTTERIAIVYGMEFPGGSREVQAVFEPWSRGARGLTHASMKEFMAQVRPVELPSLRRHRSQALNDPRLVELQNTLRAHLQAERNGNAPSVLHAGGPTVSWKEVTSSLRAVGIILSEAEARAVFEPLVDSGAQGLSSPVLHLFLHGGGKGGHHGVYSGAAGDSHHPHQHHHHHHHHQDDSNLHGYRNLRPTLQAYLAPMPNAPQPARAASVKRRSGRPHPPPPTEGRVLPALPSSSGHQGAARPGCSACKHHEPAAASAAATPRGAPAPEHHCDCYRYAYRPPATKATRKSARPAQHAAYQHIQGVGWTSQVRRR